MYKLKIICVGKIKKNYWLEAMAHYRKMLQPMLHIDLLHVKDCAQAQGEDRKRQESENILEKVGPRDALIALHETGTLFSSVEFSRFLRPLLEDPLKKCCIVIGGALGLSEQLLTQARPVSLSPLTMPHELAQVVLFEQLYRAMTILNNKTYHY